MALKQNLSQGFTLLEILIVLVIVSIITMVAVMAFGNFGRGRHEKIMIELFLQKLNIAEQQAMLQPAVLGLKFIKNGYQFYQYSVTTPQHAGSWKKLKNDKLSNRNAFAHLTLKLKIAEKIAADFSKSKVTPKIVFLPNGEVTPFSLRISGDENHIYRITMKRNGAAKLVVL